MSAGLYISSSNAASLASGSLTPSSIDVKASSSLSVGICSDGSTDACFSADLFEAAIIAYAGETGEWITESEWQAIVLATRTILIELAARFCADAVQESYFGWDPQVYASRSEHNQVRARGQLSAFHACSAQQKRLEEIVRHAFQGGKA